MVYKKIGIDVGAYSIKIATIKKVEANNSYTEENNKTYIIDSLDGDIFKFIKKCLNDFTKSNNIYFADLHFSFPYDNKNSITKNITIPNLDKKSINKGIKNEVSTIITNNIFDEKITVNDYNYNWEKINEDKDMDIAIAILAKDVTKQLSKLKRVNWKISNIELQPYSIGRLLNVENTAVIDFGHTSTRIYLYKNNKFYDGEIIDISGKTLLDEIMEQYPNIGSNELIEMIKDNDILSSKSINGVSLLTLDDDVPESIIDSSNNLLKKGKTKEEYENNKSKILKILNDISDEIKLIIRRFEMTEDISLLDVYYTGNLSNFNFLTDYISSELSIDLKPLNILNSNTNELLSSNKNNISALTAYTPAVGSMLIKEYPYYSELNFAKDARPEIDYSSILLGVLCVSIIANGAIFVIDKKYQENINTINISLGKQEATHTKLIKDTMDARDNIARDNKFIKKVDDIKAQKKWLSDIFFSLSKLAPKGVALEEIEEKAGITIISGYARDYSNIAYFILELEKIGDPEVDTIDNIPQASRDIFLYEGTNYQEKEALKHKFKITLNHKSPLLEH